MFRCVNWLRRLNLALISLFLIGIVLFYGIVRLREGQVSLNGQVGTRLMGLEESLYVIKPKDDPNILRNFSSISLLHGQAIAKESGKANSQPVPLEEINISQPPDNELPYKDSQTPHKDSQTPGKDSQTPGKDSQTPGKDSQTPDKDSQTPDKDSQTPDKDSQTPDKDSQTPDKDSQTPGKDSQTPGKDSQTPDKDSQTPDKDSQTPDKDSQTPDKDSQTPDKDSQTPGKDSQTPGKDSQTPDKDSQTPDKDSQTPDKDSQTPDKDSQTPDKDSQTPDRDRQTPDKDSQTPDKDSQTPGKDSQTPDKDSQTPGKDSQTPGNDSQTPDKDIQTSDKDSETPKVSVQDKVENHQLGKDNVVPPPKPKVDRFSAQPIDSTLAMPLIKGTKYFDAFVRQKYLGCKTMITRDTNVAYGKCRNFTNMHFINGSGLVAMPSFPGSGSTWTRTALEQATGIYTGSVYCDWGLKSKGFAGEWIVSANVLTVKTHLPSRELFPKANQFGDPNKYKDITAVILLVRNPLESFISKWNFLQTSGSHVAITAPDHFGMCHCDQ